MKLRPSRSVSFSIQGRRKRTWILLLKHLLSWSYKVGTFIKTSSLFFLTPETAGTRLTTPQYKWDWEFPRGYILYFIEDAGLHNVTESDSVKHLLISQTTGKEGSGKTSPFKNWKKKIIRMIIRHFRRKLSKSKGLRNALWNLPKPLNAFGKNKQTNLLKRTILIFRQSNLNQSEICQKMSSVYFVNIFPSNSSHMWLIFYSKKYQSIAAIIT